MSFRSYRCPACGQKTGVDILYGHPIDEAFEAAERNEIHLGGCSMEIDAPERHCTACGHEWMIQRRSANHDD